MRRQILFGGQAGQGANILTNIIAKILKEHGYHVFYSRDYQSLIRGGHNFNTLTFSNKPISSNQSKHNIIVSLDQNTLKIHKKNITENTIIINKNPHNMFLAGKLTKILGVEFSQLNKQLKKLERYKQNIKQAKQGYEQGHNKINLKKLKQIKTQFINGTQGIAQGSVLSKFDLYYAYPMTPATGVLSELAKTNKTIELENELSVINTGIGSAITGKKTMIGTSGGGFDLMTESLSLTGIAEIPLVIYLAQRQGPGTGVATYTSQADLNIARHSGHGEFPRIVLAPGDPTECQEITSQAFHLTQKFKTPAIIISDKHLAESSYTTTQKPKITPSKSTTHLKRYNSYEKDKEGSATDNPAIIIKNINKRLEKNHKIKKYTEKFQPYKIYGNKQSKNIILSWGSTKGAIIDAIKNLDCKFIQILYLEPLPEIKNIIKNKNLILIENNATGQLGDLITEKTGIFIRNKLLRYDARPFLSDELRVEIEKRLR